MSKDNQKLLQEYDAIYVAENIPDKSFIVYFCLIIFIIIFLSYNNYGSFHNMILFFMQKPSVFYFILFFFLIFLIVFSFYLYSFYNFKIIVTPQELIIKTMFEKRIPINKIAKIGRPLLYPNICTFNKTEIICEDGKKYIYPVGCHIKDLFKCLHKIKPNITLTQASLLEKSYDNCL